MFFRSLSAQAQNVTNDALREYVRRPENLVVLNATTTEQEAGPKVISEESVASEEKHLARATNKAAQILKLEELSAEALLANPRLNWKVTLSQVESDAPAVHNLIRERLDLDFLPDLRATTTLEKLRKQRAMRWNLQKLPHTLSILGTTAVGMWAGTYHPETLITELFGAAFAGMVFLHAGTFALYSRDLKDLYVRYATAENGRPVSLKPDGTFVMAPEAHFAFINKMVNGALRYCHPDLSRAHPELSALRAGFINSLSLEILFELAKDDPDLEYPLEDRLSLQYSRVQFALESGVEKMSDTDLGFAAFIIAQAKFLDEELIWAEVARGDYSRLIELG